MNVKKAIWPLAGLALLVVLGTAARGKLQEFRGKTEQVVPTARVERGDVSLDVRTTGALQAGRTAMLTAPPVSGGSLTIVHLLKTGTPVKKGDLVVEFDPSEQEYNLEQAKSDLAQAEQEITKAKADAAVQAAQDQVTLLKDQFDVKRAEFEVSKNELVSAIDAKKNTLALEEAKRALAQFESDMKSHAISSQATLAVNQEKRQKATLSMQEAERNIASLRVVSPIDGLVEVKLNQRAGGGFFFTGMVLPEFREGDQAYPGQMIAQAIDPGDMEIQAKVDEVDRANLSQGQAADVQIDALPGRTFSGKVKTIAGMASRGDWWEGGSTMSKFGVTFEIEKPGPELRPGYSAHVTIAANSLHDVLYVPTQAVFEKNGKPVVYVKNGSAFRTQEVKIKSHAEARTVVEGVAVGTEVALLNPEVQSKSAAKTAGPLGTSLGGGGR